MSLKKGSHFKRNGSSSSPTIFLGRHSSYSLLFDSVSLEFDSMETSWCLVIQPKKTSQVVLQTSLVKTPRLSEIVSKVPMRSTSEAFTRPRLKMFQNFGHLFTNIKHLSQKIWSSKIMHIHQTFHKTSNISKMHLGTLSQNIKTFHQKIDEKNNFSAKVTIRLFSIPSRSTWSKGAKSNNKTQ